MKPTLILACAALALGLAGCEQTNKRSAVFTVDSKERRCDSSGQGVSCAYYVYGTSGEVFRNEDAWVFGERLKTDSATMQARLKVGQAYQVETIGWRIPWLSMSPNIVAAQPVETTHLTAPLPTIAN